MLYFEIFHSSRVRWNLQGQRRNEISAREEIFFSFLLFIQTLFVNSHKILVTIYETRIIADISNRSISRYIYAFNATVCV